MQLAPLRLHLQIFQDRDVNIRLLRLINAMVNKYGVKHYYLFLRATQYFYGENNLVTLFSQGRS